MHFRKHTSTVTLPCDPFNIFASFSRIKWNNFGGPFVHCYYFSLLVFQLNEFLRHFVRQEKKKTFFLQRYHGIIQVPFLEIIRILLIVVYIISIYKYINRLTLEQTILDFTIFFLLLPSISCLFQI